MNVFALDDDQDACAAAHADQHVGKMLLEACQMLCCAHELPRDRERWLGLSPAERLQEGLLPYSHTHRNHPCAVWVRESIGNYVWLVGLAWSLADEWTHRFGKPHGSELVADWCAERGALVRFSGRSAERTPFAQAMPEQYRQPDAVAAYRTYYAAEKRVLRGKPATWTRRPRPAWFDRVTSPATPTAPAAPPAPTGPRPT